MRHVLIIDSMANMPEHVLKNRTNIKVLPLNIRIGGAEFRDPITNTSLKEFYQSRKFTTESKIDAFSPTSEQLLVELLNEVVPNYDVAICQTTSAVLSVVNRSFEDCAQMMPAEAKTIRNMAKVDRPFRMIVSSSGASSSGQTILALYTDSLLSRGTDIDDAVNKSEVFKKRIRTYSVVKDILYARNRMSFLGFKTISLATAVSGQLQGFSPIIKVADDVLKPAVLKIRYDKAIAKLFAYAEEAIHSGLYIPIIHVAYAGMLNELQAMSSFQALQSTAKKKGVTLISSMMSASGCINYSPGSVSLGLAPKDEELEPR